MFAKRRANVLNLRFFTFYKLLCVGQGIAIKSRPSQTFFRYPKSTKSNHLAQIHLPRAPSNPPPHPQKNPAAHFQAAGFFCPGKINQTVYAKSNRSRFITWASVVACQVVPKSSKFTKKPLVGASRWFGASVLFE
jgi:hypothetical protein